MPLTEKLSILLETVGAGGVVSDFNKIAGASKKLGGDAVATGGKLDKLASGLGVSASTLKMGLVGGALAAGSALAAFGVKSVQTYTASTRAVNDFQRASGATAEQSSLLVAAMDDVGISAQSGASAMFQLAKRVETSGEKLAAFGLEVTRDKKGNTDLAATLLDVSDTYRSIQDPAQKAAFLTAAFGKQGKDLIPILEKGKSGIEAMFQGARDTGQVFTEDDLQRSRDYIESMDALGDAMAEVALAAGKFLTPIVAGIADTITSTIGAVEGFVGGVTNLADKLNKMSGATDDADDETTGFGDTLNAFYNEILRGREPVEDATEDVEDLGGAVAELGGIFSFINPLLDEATAAAADQAEALDDLVGVTLAATTAQRALVQAGLSLESAQRSEADAQEDLNDLLETGRFNLEAIKDAEDALASAKRSTGKATRDQAKAQKEYDDALAVSKVLGTDDSKDKLADAADHLADANDGLADANEREADAARALKAEQAGDPEWQDKLADAKQRVKDATQGVADATYTLSQRGYEAVKADTAETLALDAKAGALADVRGELEKIITLHPETLAFLGPALAGLPSGPAIPAVPSGGGASGSWGPASTTNNVTVNVATGADADQIAREVSWALIP